MASQERQMPFIKNLASSDRKTRTAALTSLRTFLSSKPIATNLSTLDTLKLWKGLFYALWMCDRPLPQQALCTDLAELLWVLPQTSTIFVVRWLRAFWATMAREWTTGIDVLRMEKFLLLVRRMLGASLVWMQVRDAPAATSTRKGAAKKRTAAGKDKKATAGGAVRFDEARTEAVLALLAEWPFRAEEELEKDEEEVSTDVSDGVDLMPRIVPVGLRLHVLDIWVDEAEKAGLLAEDEEEAKGSFAARAVLLRINGLVEALNDKTLSKAVRIRSKDALADERLPWVEEEVVEEVEGDEWKGFGN